MRWKLTILSLCIIADTALSYQKPSVMRPDGVTHRSEQHLVDLSSCDTVEIEVRLRDVQVDNGMFRVYWFKKYADISHLTVKCLTESEVHKK